MTVNIHGKEYVTVAERLTEARPEILSITTEVLVHEPVVIKATVNTKRGTYTGISSANPSKTIEKASPYEVAETSAVGRALGFAGYGATDSIATADEMKKVEDPTESWAPDKQENKLDICPVHKILFKDRRWTNPDGSKKDHRMQIDGVWNYCSGHGYHIPESANSTA